MFQQLCHRVSDVSICVFCVLLWKPHHSCLICFLVVNSIILSSEERKYEKWQIIEGKLAVGEPYWSCVVSDIKITQGVLHYSYH